MPFSDSEQNIFEKIGEFWDDVLEKIDDFFYENKFIKIAGLLLVLLALIFLAYLTLFASRPGFEIKVIDENGNPVDGALIRLFDENGNSVAAVRAINGTARFAVENKKYGYKISREGFEDATGEYNPASPEGNLVRLKRRSSSDEAVAPKTTQPASGSINAFSPPQIPTIETLSLPPTGQEPDEVIKPPTSSPKPTYSADAKLLVIVKDKKTSVVLPGTVVTLKDGSTNMFLAQGQTNSAGSLEAAVKQGSSVVVQARVAGYVASDVKIVPITSASVETEILLIQEGQGTSANSTVSVKDSQGNFVEGARVQVFSSPPLFDQLTSASGRLSFTLESNRVFRVLASKAGFKDAVVNLTSGRDVALVLESDLGPFATLVVNVTESSGAPSANAGVAVFKKVNSTYVDYKSQTANEAGVANFENLQVTEVRVNATSARGEPSVSGDLTLQAGLNNLNLRFAPSMQVTSTPSPPPSVSPSPPPVIGGRSFRVCLNQAFSISSNTSASFNYTLKDISTTATAVFEITQESNPPLIVCSARSSACTYALGKISSENQQLAKTTGINVYLSAVDPQQGCVSVTAGGDAACLGENCPCSPQDDPVCGSNGITYANACEAGRAGVSHLKGVCAFVCTRQYDPVCGSDGQTYQNICEAKNANALPYTPGECPPFFDVGLLAGWSLIAPTNAGRLFSTTCTYLNPTTNQRAHMFQGYRNGQFYSVRPTEGATTEMVYGTGYWMFSSQACLLRWVNQTTTQYAPVLTEGYTVIGGPSEPATFNQLRGSCPAYVVSTPAPSPSPASRPTTLWTGTPALGWRGCGTGQVMCGLRYGAGIRCCTLSSGINTGSATIRHLSCQSNEFMTGFMSQEVEGVQCLATSVSWTSKRDIINQPVGNSVIDCNNDEAICESGDLRSFGSAKCCKALLNQQVTTPTSIPARVPVHIRIYTAEGVVSDAAQSVESYRLVSPDEQLRPGRGYFVWYDGSAGATCNMGAPSEPAPEPDRLLYRCYNGAVANELDHILTTRSDCEGAPGWRFEGGFSEVYSTQKSDTVPLYRCRYAGWHHYETLDSNCEQAKGSVLEGILGYIRSSPASGFLPFYRCFGGGNGDHLTTFSSSCEGASGYTSEFMFGYAKPASRLTTTPAPTPTPVLPTSTPTPALLGDGCKNAGGVCVDPGPAFFKLPGDICSNGGKLLPQDCGIGSTKICCTQPAETLCPDGVTRCLPSQTCVFSPKNCFKQPCPQYRCTGQSTK